MYKKYAKLLVLLVFVFTVTGCAVDLPELAVPEASIVFDINGEPIKGLASENRISIGFEEIPDSFKNAIIAVEDKNFYKHPGIDVIGILRAIIVNLRAGEITAGGSTITQQTAKNLFLSNERTFIRKIKELFYALEIERRYSKDEIITMYCNTIYFGHGAYGLEVAARTFFGKSAIDLNPEESALLAGLPQAPSVYDPYVNPEKARDRQKVVLQRMVEEGFISASDQQDLLSRELEYTRADYVQGDAPYFISMVKDYLSKKYGERMVVQGGMRVYTTLDLDMQRAANNAYQNGMAEREEGVQAALVAVDVSNGHIRALIGGRDFASSTYNRVFAERQPGSTFKPFIYSLAMQWGLTQADMLKCEWVKYELPNGDTYEPSDYGDEKYHWRNFTFKEALMISDNVVAVRLNEMLGPQYTAAHAEKFGFEDLPPILSLPLGSIEASPLQMAAAYSVFASGGIYSEPVYIIKVVDNNGKILEDNRVQRKRVVSAENAYIITDMMKGVLEPGGTGSHLNSRVGRPAAGKTGTTDEFNDAWFVGYTPRLCCAVWVGFDRGQNVNLVGGIAAGPIWADFLREASADLPSEDFNKPEDIILVSVCPDTGLIASESCPRKMQMAFIKGTEPKTICSYHLPGMEWILEDEDIPWWIRFAD